jgi:type IX secretion system PorP/SprF family membrane protein
MKKGILLTLASVGLLAAPGFSQDIHFSQFNASPLTLNPALAGKLECTYRAAINYRNQWNSIPAPFETYSAGFDAAIGKGRTKAGHEALGIGILAMQDVAGDGALSNLSLNAFLAYHKALGRHSVMSVGFQGVYAQRGVNIGDLLFADQIVNGTTTTLEVFDPNFTYMDVNAGLHWSSFWDYFSFNLGAAYYHILEPVESFQGNQNSTLPARYVGHGGISAKLGEYIILSPSFLFMQQAAVNQLNLGSSIGYYFDNGALYGGLWHRRVRGGANADAIIALVGIDIANITLGVSYDVSVSEIHEANSGKGGFEVSLAYNGCIATKTRVICPTFKPKF